MRPATRMPAVHAADSTRCQQRTLSAQWAARRPMWPAARTATLPVASTPARPATSAQRLEACRCFRLAKGVVCQLPNVAAMFKSAMEVDERRLVFCGDGGWGRRRKKNMISGFHGFYHGSPYSFIIFLMGRKVLCLCF